MLIVETNYVNGVPQTGVAGWAPRGVAWHWSAGGSGRAGWEATIRHLVNTRWTVNASYHGGFWGEHDAAHRACRTIIQWIVPTTKAAHSIAPSRIFVLNPNKPRLRQETRFVEVRRILARDNDPNADCLAVAYAGMPADLARDRACSVFMADVRNLARQLVAHPATVDRPHFGHGWIQPITRYEMDLPEDFVALLYQEPAVAPVEDTDMPVITKTVREQWDIPAHTPLYTGGPELGARLTFPVDNRLWSNGETEDGRWRRVEGVGPTQGQEFYVRRTDMTVVPGTRNPKAGFGPPDIEGFTGDQLEAAERNAFEDGRDGALAVVSTAITAAKAITRKET